MRILIISFLLSCTLTAGCAYRGNYQAAQVQFYEDKVAAGEYKKVEHEGGEIAYYPLRLDKYYEPERFQVFELDKFESTQEDSDLIYEPTGELRDRIVSDYQQGTVVDIFVRQSNQSSVENSLSLEKAILLEPASKKEIHP